LLGYCTPRQPAHTKYVLLGVLGWIWQDKPGANTPFSISAYGIQCSGQANLVNNTIGAVGATNASANLGIFVNPVPVTGYGDRHSSGSGINSTANPAIAGAALLTDPDFLLTANIATLDRDYLRWNKDGNPRTTPGSVGAY